MLKIALGYQSRVGKDTFVDICRKKYSVYQITLAEPLYRIAGEVQRALGMPVVKNPSLLQTLGTVLRDMDPNFIDNQMKLRLAECPPCHLVIVSDVRMPTEFDSLVAEGFIMVNIKRDGRPIDRDQSHPTEHSLSTYKWDYVINNDGDMEKYERDVLALVEQIIQR